MQVVEVPEALAVVVLMLLEETVVVDKEVVLVVVRQLEQVEVEQQILAVEVEVLFLLKTVVQVDLV